MNTNVTSLLKKLLVLSLAVATAAPLCAMVGADVVGADAAADAGVVGADAGADAAKVVMNRRLLEAAARGDWEAMIRLLFDGTDATFQDNEGLTALHYAARYGHVNVVPVLVIAGANMNAQDNEGRTALYYAAIYGHDKVVIELLSQGADVTITDNHVLTPANEAGDAIESHAFADKHPRRAICTTAVSVVAAALAAIACYCL